MEPTEPGHAPETVTRAPAPELIRPLRRAPPVAAVETGPDDSTVHEAARPGSDTTSEHRRRRLVLKVVPAVHVANREQRQSPIKKPERFDVSVLSGRPDSIGLLAEGGRLLELPFDERDTARAPLHETMLRRFGHVAQVARGALEPAPRHRHLPSLQVDLGERRGGTRRAPAVLPVEIGADGALERPDGGARLSRAHGGLRESLELGGDERLLALGPLELANRAPPVAFLRSPPCPRERISFSPRVLHGGFDFRFRASFLDEAVSLAGVIADGPLTASAAKRGAREAYGPMERPFADVHAAPERLQELGVGHHPLAVPHQVEEKLQHPWLQVEGVAVQPELPRLLVQFERSESMDHRFRPPMISV